MSEMFDHKPRILIVDDEQAIRDLLADMLSDEYACVTSGSAEAALGEFQKTSFDLVISDINLGGMSGVEMAPKILSTSPDTVIMMISGAQSVESAIDALRVGVFDYVRKPFDHDQVISAVRKALSHRASLVAKRRHALHLETLVEQKSAELHHLTHHDVLTDLPNETMFEDHLREILAGSGGTQQVGVLLIGVSNLRSIRDSLGQSAANQIVLEMSHRLRSSDQERSIARLDGDRFALFVSPTDLENVVGVTNEIFEIVKPPFLVDDREIHVHVNIGISVFPDDGTDCLYLLRNAGAALSQADAEGFGRYQFYAAEMNARAIKQLTLENHLRRALERDELVVFYQPKIDVRTKSVTGMEALLRWNSHELGPVSPSVFIPIAESSELIIPIGEWVLRSACFQTKRWHDNGFPLHLAVNLSARQFQDKNLSNKIWSILDETGIDPHFLNLEVTESSIVTDPDAAIKILTQLQTLGVSISIDDFGMGHSSFSYLRSLPIDVLKIDKSFVRNITNDVDAATLVKTIITLAHDLRLRVIAEGVETEDQLKVLTSMECDAWQGFLHNKPLPASEFEQGLRMGWDFDVQP